MKQHIKIAVIGGTGKSGKYLVRELLQQGFQCKLLLRKPENLTIKSSFIEVVKGDARDYGPIRLLIDGCDAVISTLGQPKGETTIFSQATQNVIRAMGECNVKRYLLITGLNVDTPFDKKGPKTKFGTDWMKTNYPETTSDKQVEYEVLVNSDVDWTIVRLPLIEQTNEQRNIQISLEDCPGDKISATDLAHFLIRQLTEDLYFRQAPFLANV